MLSRSRVQHLMALAILSLATVGCSSPKNIVHRINVSQGDYLDSRQLQQLKVGITKDQVLSLLGRPEINDHFASKNTLVYLNWQRKGHRSPTQKTLRLHFDEQNRLKRIERDFPLQESFNSESGDDHKFPEER